ncbi:hypothetical protein F2Q69_00054247 [Brassica cretica]|uniref:Uncharacterized protein n=1 Tax=Brassica cretica TaxID=69181 RepID=A0A8S9MV00_BRACR|nr:hypothetical protein F2Q69_00054247 [Brassica cretica]
MVCAPFHSVMATPLLVASEILLCVHLEDQYVVYDRFGCVLLLLAFGYDFGTVLGFLAIVQYYLP